MGLKAKANPKTRLEVLNEAGEGVPVYWDEAVPLNQLHLIDDAGTLVKTVDLRGQDENSAGGQEQPRARAKR